MRIGAPDPEVIDIFKAAGAQDPAVHALTEEERALVSAALARLPSLHRGVLRRHLRRLSFLDFTSGAGSALTSRVGPGMASVEFDITLRASILGESLTSFLNTKEARLFAEDGSGFSVAFDAGGADALTYVLLHEASHVVDQVLGITSDEDGVFRSGIWADLRALEMPYASSLIAETPFRGAPAIPLREAEAHYRALSESPFVSFYATAAAVEDFAEVFAWQQLGERFGQRLTLSIRDRAGAVVFSYEPLEAPRVRSRLEHAEKLLLRFEEDCGQGRR